MAFNPIALAKRTLFWQVWKCTGGTEAHLAAIRSFHKAAWDCFDARKCDPPEMRTQYYFTTRQGEHTSYIPTPKTNAKDTPNIDPRTKKAILAVERDCEFCWQELHFAIASCEDGTRSKIRALDALNKWRKDYDAHWDKWLARGAKKLPAKLRNLKEFAEKHGQIHFVAGEERYFATAKEAQRFKQSCETFIKGAEAEQLYHSETNQKLCELYERAMDDPTLWESFKLAMDAADAEEAAAERQDDDETEN